MSKRLPSAQGVPAKDLLQKIVKNPLEVIVHPHEAYEKEVYLGVTRDIARELMARVNPDVCLNESQVDALANDIDVFSLKVGANSDIKSEGIHTGHLSAIGEAHFSKSPETIHELATHINSYRLACANCLNQSCEMRENTTK